MIEKLTSCIEKAEATFDRLQELDIQPSLANTEKLLKSLYDLRDIYIALSEIKNDLGGEEDGRDSADPCGRDGD